MGRAVVVGAGMVGLHAAYALRRRGLEVTVVDKGEAGMACSFGNAGLVCPSLSAPLPAPGLVGRSLRWMLQRDSPLYIKPGALPETLGWLLAFWRHCNAQDYSQGLLAMLGLNQRTLSLYDMLTADGVEFEMHRQGLLFAFTREGDLVSELDELREVAQFGLPAPQVLAHAEVLAEEPNLSDRVVGGILLPAERHVEPHSLSRGMVRWLAARGVDLRQQSEVQAFEHKGDAVVAVQTASGRIEGDLFVLAAGVWTRRLAAMLGSHLPIQAGKGYSLSLSSPNLQFRHALYLAGTKVVLSPYEDTVRLAGTMEFSGMNARLDTVRLDGLRSAARNYLREELRGATESAWTGMRPMTPDGLPIIGRLPRYRNVFVSTGHGANGIFMSPTSGELLADLAVDGESAIDPTPFDPVRFTA